MAQEQLVSIDELTTFNITAVLHSPGTPDGLMTKTDQSKLVKHLTGDADDVRLSRGNISILFIEDRNARLH